MNHPIKHPNPQVSSAKISNLSHDGRGIAHIDGKITFIQNALPEEIVTFQYQKKQRNFDEGIAIAIENPSPLREIPGCKHFAICGGCSLQHINSQTQIKFKEQHLLEQLKHFGKIEPLEVLPPITGPIWQYREKARLSVKYIEKKDKLLVGFREKQSHLVADIEQCEILAAPAGTLISDLKNLIIRLSVKQHIPQIEIALNETAPAFIFRHLKPFSNKDLEELTLFAQTKNIYLYLQPGGLKSTHLLWPENSEQKLFYSLPEFNLKLAFNPNDFSQVNSAVNRQMVNQALKLLEPNSNETILDLFCGVGNFTLAIANLVKEVIGIEGEENLIARAKMNATLNNINNANFFKQDLTKKPEGSWINLQYDKILLDPPRSGAEQSLPLIGNIAPKRIVYISCNPATFARDAGILVHQYGYKLLKVGVLDMFPHTSHVESMGLFQKDFAPSSVKAN